MSTVWTRVASGLRGRRTLAVVTGLMAWSAGTDGARAAAPVVGAVPGIQTAPAPPWVQPGMRLTYYSAIANVPSGLEFWEPADDGGWEDRQTGQRWRKTKVTEGRGSGHGYTEVTVLAVDGGLVALEVRSYGFPKYQGPVALIGTSSVVTIPGYGNDWWVSPGALQQTPQGIVGGLKVLAMNHTLGEKTYRALRFQFESADTRQELLTGLDGQVIPTGIELQARKAVTYDLDSGILLSARTAGSSPKGTTLTECTLVHARPVTVPWAGQPAPDWVARTTTVEYAGGLHSSYGAQPVTIPLSATATFQRRGPNWAHYTLRLSQASLLATLPPTVNEIQRVTGGATFTGLWVPPAGLAALRQGQELDRDPITGVVVAVAQADANRVVLSETTAFQRIDVTYDRASGLMVGYEKTDFHLFNLKTVLSYRGMR